MNVNDISTLIEFGVLVHNGESDPINFKFEWDWVAEEFVEPDNNVRRALAGAGVRVELAEDIIDLMDAYTSHGLATLVGGPLVKIFDDGKDFVAFVIRVK